MPHEMSGQNVDVILIGADVGIFRRDFVEALVPKGHGEDDAVGFGSGRQVFFALAGQLEGVTDYPGYAAAREDGLLEGQFVWGAFIKAAAYVGVFAFAVFAD